VEALATGQLVLHVPEGRPPPACSCYPTPPRPARGLSPRTSPGHRPRGAPPDRSAHRRRPSALRHGRLRVRRDAVLHGHRWPVLLLHGSPARAPCGTPCPMRCVRRASATSSASGVHLIGHSRGGVLLRQALDCRTFVGGRTTVVTIACPLAGVGLARWMSGSCARLMRPGPPGRPASRASLAATRWITSPRTGIGWCLPRPLACTVMARSSRTRTSRPSA
jgi:hypothetical protein